MSDSDKLALLNNTATISTKIEILPKEDGEETITLTENDSVRSWTYSDLRYVENQGFIGQFVARTFDGEFKDISDDFNIEDRKIVAYLGVNRYENNELVTTYYKLGTFLVEKPNSDEVQDNTQFKSQDYTMLFNKPFNPDYIDSEYTVSFNQRLQRNIATNALWLLQYACKQAGVELGTQSFTNSTFSITSNQFNSDDTLRDVVKAIAKLGYTWARIDWDDKLYLDFSVQTSVSTYNTITNDNYYTLETQKDDYGEVNRVYIGSSIVENLGEYVENSASISTNGLCELDIYDNPITNTDEIRQLAIQQGSVLFGLKYKPVKIETTGHPWLKGNELIQISDMESNTFTTYAFDRILKYDGHIRSTLYSYASTETENDYTYDGADLESTKLRRARVELDRQALQLSLAMEDIDEQNSKIASLTISVDELDSKIQDIADITTSAESSYATVDLDNVNESEPIMIKVHPINTNISYLYPNTGLYPSSTTYLKIRTLRFTNTTENTYIDYELPDDLLYYDENNYDEFYLSYDSMTCQITKKCKWNADGSVGLLTTSRVDSYTYPTLILTDGNYTVSLPSYTTGYLSVRMVAKNAYTTQFYTKVETNALISETADSITAGVNQTLTNYSTTSEMNSAIEIKAGEITTGVSQTYSTKTETNTAKDTAISTSDAHTDTKLLNYTNTTDTEAMISAAIENGSASILATVSDTYTTIETYETGIGDTNASISGVSSALERTNSQLQTTDSKFSNYATNTVVNSVTNRVTALETSSTVQLDIIEDIQQNGVSKVKTETNYTFDSEGLKIKKSGEPTDSKVDNNGVLVKNGDETLLFAGYDTATNTSKVEAHDMSVQDHEILMNHIRVEEYSTGVGWFWLG